MLISGSHRHFWCARKLLMNLLALWAGFLRYPRSYFMEGNVVSLHRWRCAWTGGANAPKASWPFNPLCGPPVERCRVSMHDTAPPQDDIYATPLGTTGGLILWVLNLCSGQLRMLITATCHHLCCSMMLSLWMRGPCSPPLHLCRKSWRLKSASP